MRAVPPFAPSQSVRVLTLAMIITACQQRRDGIDERVPFLLGAEEEWAFSTHPSVPLAATDLRELTGKAMLATGRFAPSTEAESTNGSPALAARVSAQIVSADSTPVSSAPADGVVLQVRVRFQLIPALGDEAEAFIAVATGSGRGAAQDAARAAVSAALGRAIDQVTMAQRGRAKSDEELVSELRSADPLRAQAASESLAGRRNQAAFTPLVSQLRGDDLDAAQRALSSLVTLDDPRAVGPIIQEAEHRDLPFTIEALYAVGSIGGEEAEGYLFTLTSDSDARVRAAATEALALARRRATATRRTRPAAHTDEQTW